MCLALPVACRVTHLCPHPRCAVQLGCVGSPGAWGTQHGTGGHRAALEWPHGPGGHRTPPECPYRAWGEQCVPTVLVSRTQRGWGAHSKSLCGLSLHQGRTVSPSQGTPGPCGSLAEWAWPLVGPPWCPVLQMPAPVTALCPGQHLGPAACARTPWHSRDERLTVTHGAAATDALPGKGGWAEVMHLSAVPTPLWQGLQPRCLCAASGERVTGRSFSRLCSGSGCAPTPVTPLSRLGIQGSVGHPCCSPLALSAPMAVQGSQRQGCTARAVM